MNYKQLATYANTTNGSLDTALKCLEISLVCSRNSVIILQSLIFLLPPLHQGTGHRKTSTPMKCRMRFTRSLVPMLPQVKLSIFNNSESENVWLEDGPHGRQAVLGVELWSP